VYLFSKLSTNILYKFFIQNLSFTKKTLVLMLKILLNYNHMLPLTTESTTNMIQITHMNDKTCTRVVSRIIVGRLIAVHASSYQIVKCFLCALFELEEITVEYRRDYDN